MTELSLSSIGGGTEATLGKLEMFTDFDIELISSFGTIMFFAADFFRAASFFWAAGSYSGLTTYYYYS